jgi:hypothetical protein
MKFTEFEPKKVEQLDEVRMGPSDLDKFVNSEDATGIQAGFEAELCFSNRAGDNDDGEVEEDYSEDERVSDIRDICRFFSNNDYNSRRDVENLREEMSETYYEWRGEKMSDAWMEVEESEVESYIENNDYTFEDEVEEYLRDELDLSAEKIKEVLAVGDTVRRAHSIAARTELENNDPRVTVYLEAADHAYDVLADLVKDAINNHDHSYRSAYEDWESEHEDDSDWDEDHWLDSIGVHYMSDVTSHFGHVTWPYYTSSSSDEGGFNEHSANMLSDSMASKLGVRSRASSGYHSATRSPGLWIIEPDSSLEASDPYDMPAEIISPPMPLQECLEKMKRFFEWAKSEKAYSNESTGLHVGVSLPRVGGNVDYLKLALFLGDQHVLETFGRECNTYTRSAYEKIADQVKTNGADNRVTDTLKVLQHGLTELAQKTLKTNANGYGKYTSINPKGEYIEFRSMGNNYMEMTDQVIEIVKRYAYAMHIASRPELHKQEYSKKLYKLLSSVDKSAPVDTIKLFSAFSSGSLNKTTLVSMLRTIHASRKPAPPSGPGTYEMYRISDGRTMSAGGKEVQFNANSEEEAQSMIAHYAQEYHLGAPQLFAVRSVVKPSGKAYQIYRNDTGNTLTSFFAGSDREAIAIMNNRVARMAPETRALFSIRVEGSNTALAHGGGGEGAGVQDSDGVIYRVYDTRDDSRTTIGRFRATPANAQRNFTAYTQGVTPQYRQHLEYEVETQRVDPNTVD